MMGNISINLSLSNIYTSWYAFCQGKRKTPELEEYRYYLEKNIFNLYEGLNNKSYRHGGYRSFWVSDSKRRKIAVASIDDRIVHRLLYEFMVRIFDQTFIFDAWSCRKNKGLTGAINRAQKFSQKYKDGFFWKADIKKFFDYVDHENLRQFIFRRIDCKITQCLLDEIISSYGFERDGSSSNLSVSRRGIPIGNLTSQIFANIYLNELDRFVKHGLLVKAYLRYGDDFAIFSHDLDELNLIKAKTIDFITNRLRLIMNPRVNSIYQVNHGIYFLGVRIYPNGRRLSGRNRQRTFHRLNNQNISSYRELVQKHDYKKLSELDWVIKDLA